MESLLNQGVGAAPDLHVAPSSGLRGVDRIPFSSQSPAVRRHSLFPRVAVAIERMNYIVTVRQTGSVPYVRREVLPFPVPFLKFKQYISYFISLMHIMVSQGFLGLACIVEFQV